jgi:dTDP-4-amino-4,6-dideoxygalactose transaminase
MRLAEKYNIPVLEDCAQSHFSEFNGKRAGLFGLAGSFSFYPGKNLGAYGDAGCIITKDDEFALKCKMYARHGALIKHQHKMEGINSRLDGLQAAILSAKLPHILDWTEKRRRVADIYTEKLEGIGDLVLPKLRPDTKHSYHLYVVRTNHRDALQNSLSENNIDTAIHYPVALPNMDAYKYLGNKKEDFPVASAYENQMLSLPIYPEITEEQLNLVVSSIQSFFEKESY